MYADFDIDNFNYNTNNVIEASAGTGKTYTITKLIVPRLLEDERYSLSNILIVTYTKKAAGELRSRIRQELIDIRATSKDLSEKQKDKIAHEIEQIDDAPIFTIHSFCQKVLEENAIYSNCSQNMTLIDENVGLETFIGKYMRDILAKDSEDKDIFLYLHRTASTKQNANNRPFQEIAKEAIKKYYLDKNGEENPDIISLDTLSPEEENEYNDFLRSPDDEKRNRIMCYFVVKHLKEMYLAWQNEKKEKNLQTYTDMIKLVHDAINDKQSDLLLKLKEQYKYAIIDEFQDTNQLQWNIFKRIFTTDDECHITIVGDPKQSIFSFQDADSAIYDIAKQHIGQCHNLSTNYRSTNSMIDAINVLSRDEGFCNYPYYQESKSSGRIKSPQICGHEGKPVHIINNDAPVEDIIISKIIEYCTKTEDNKTALQLWDKDNKTYRDATFNDFTIIVRGRATADKLITGFKDAGIPFMWHKDDSLFADKEAADWSALLTAIEAPDFNSTNRGILRKALKTEFFDVSLDELSDEKYDDILCPERQTLLKWRNLATNRQYSKLLNSIFEDSGLASRLASFDKLQSLAKYNQIGNFILDYLVSKHASIATVIKMLNQPKTTEIGNENQTSVEKSTDRPTVKLSTIHSAKGLEFPVVFYFLSANINRLKFVRIQHRANGTFLNIRPVQEKKDSDWQALRYVAITRASSLMFLIPKRDTKKCLDFWEDTLPTLFVRESGCIKYTSAEHILKDDVCNLEDQQPEKPGKIALARKKLYKHSYTSLSHRKTDEDEQLNDLPQQETLERIDKEEELTSNDHISTCKYDADAGVEICDEMYDTDKIQPVSAQSPAERGTKYGTIIHEIFEKIDFRAFETELYPVINACCKKYAVNCSREQIISFVTNTMTAKIPEIVGNHATGVKFQLSELEEKNKKSEIEFNLHPDIEKTLLNYCNGFIDLLFFRQVNGQKVYSILDWKTDFFEEEKYADYKYLKYRTDEYYAIQRVLYSYCLIKWLKLFYPDKSEAEIFNTHFGGIYYVYVRGCNAETGNGIYAHTWRDYDTLKKAFDGLTEIIKGLYNG